MPHYLSHGTIPKKRFTVFRKPDGGMYYEHLLSTEQTLPESSILYRIHAPSRVTRVDEMPPVELAGAGRPLGRVLLFQPERIESSGDFVDARVPALFAGERLVFSVARPDRPMQRFYCNIYADELIVVVRGSGVLETVLGDIPYGELDLLHIPRGITVRWVCDPVPHELGVFESHSPIRPPRGFVKKNGQFADAASYHERDLRTPRQRQPVDEKGEFPVVIKDGSRRACSYFDHHPFDVVGWDGCYYPFAFNLRDYEPLSGRIFLLVDRYQVFASDDAAFITVTPRRLPDIHNATGNPFHTSILGDEILYRMRGDTGETEPGTGTFTLTPRGTIHGPKPGFEHAAPRTRIDWWGLMLETPLPLEPSVQAMAACDASFARAILDDQRVAKQSATGGRTV